MAKRINGAIEYRTQRKAAPNLTDEGKLTGRAAPFDSQTMIGSKPWGFREKINASAFSKSIKDGDVVLLDNHDSAKPIARMSAGTLDLREGPEGLDWDATPVDTTYAQDAVKNVRAKNYGGCSFGFEVVRDKWTYNEEDDIDERELLEVKLHEISVCTFPAYGDTSVGTRDQFDAAMEARTRFYERELRAKYSADQLKELLSKGQAFKNANGDPSYPIADAEDLGLAIKAVGRGGADHDAIRKYIIGRAKALGLSDKIPDNWNADGSITAAAEKNSAPEVTVSGHDYTDMAASLVTLYNALPKDQRVKVRDAILENRADADVEDLSKAIKAAKSKADRVAAIALAKKLNASKMIPDNWNSDGDLVEPANEQKSEDDSEKRSDENRAASFRKAKFATLAE